MKKMTRRLFVLAISLLMLVGCMSGCGKGGELDIHEGENDPNVPQGRVGVTYWGTWGADSKAYIQEVIDQFNASQNTYYVTMQYVGGRDDLYAKMQVTEKGKLPALINTTTEMTGAFMYSDWIAPIYELAGTEDQQYVDRIYGNLVGTWGDREGRLLGYPMGNSMTGVYFNMDVMEKAGIDPYEDFKCVDDLYQICRKLKDGGYLPGDYAIGFEHSVRFLDYSLAIEGVEAYNNGNGSTEPASESYYNTSPVKELCEKFFQTYLKFQNEGLCYTMGASFGNELIPAYATGDIAILTGTIGGYGRLERGWAESNSQPMNTVFMPWVPVTREGRATGQPSSGNGFYVIDNGNEEQQKGAWEFINFFTSGDNFAGWCKLTGYLPIADDILNTDIYKQYMADHPSLGLDYLMEVQRNDDGKTFHPISAVYSNTSAIGLNKFDKILGGTSIDTALAEMESEVNNELSMWRIANGY